MNNVTEIWQDLQNKTFSIKEKARVLVLLIRAALDEKLNLSDVATLLYKSSNNEIEIKKSIIEQIKGDVLLTPAEKLRLFKALLACETTDSFCRGTPTAFIQLYIDSLVAELDFQKMNGELQLWIENNTKERADNAMLDFINIIFNRLGDKSTSNLFLFRMIKAVNEELTNRKIPNQEVKSMITRWITMKIITAVTEKLLKELYEIDFKNAINGMETEKLLPDLNRYDVYQSEIALNLKKEEKEDKSEKAKAIKKHWEKELKDYGLDFDKVKKAHDKLTADDKSRRDLVSYALQLIQNSRRESDSKTPTSSSSNLNSVSKKLSRTLSRKQVRQINTDLQQKQQKQKDEDLIRNKLYNALVYYINHNETHFSESLRLLIEMANNPNLGTAADEIILKLNVAEKNIASPALTRSHSSEALISSSADKGKKRNAPRNHDISSSGGSLSGSAEKKVSAETATLLLPTPQQDPKARVETHSRRTSSAGELNVSMESRDDLEIIKRIENPGRIRSTRYTQRTPVSEFFASESSPVVAKPGLLSSTSSAITEADEKSNSATPHKAEYVERDYMYDVSSSQ